MIDTPEKIQTVVNYVADITKHSLLDACGWLHVGFQKESWIVRNKTGKKARLFFFYIIFLTELSQCSKSGKEFAHNILYSYQLLQDFLCDIEICHTR